MPSLKRRQQSSESDYKFKVIQIPFKKGKNWNTIWITFFTLFSHILHKDCYLLYTDTTLELLTNDRPLITFRRAPSLHDKLVHSEFTTKKQFPCGHCGYCKYKDTRKKIILPNGDDFKPKHYVNCHTAGVVYLLNCDCGSFYVGKTKLKLWRRIFRHVVSIEKLDHSLPLGRHSALIHGDSTPKVTFLTLDHFGATPRWGDYNKSLLLKWIFHLKSTTASGLNEAFHFRPYLAGFESGVCELDL